MPELTTADVETYTQGRVPANARTGMLLAAALVEARRFCGWHVTPVQTDTVALDGPGANPLGLPTMQLVGLASITQDGDEVDLGELHWLTPTDGQPRRGLVSKKRTSAHRWSTQRGSITVTMAHGFDDDGAADWRLGVLRTVERMASSTRDTPDMKRKKVDDVEYEWFEVAASLLDEATLAPYRLLPET